MALARFVVTADTTISAGTATAVTDGFGTVSWSAALAPYAGPFPVTVRKGMVIWADSAGGTSTGAQLLYTAIGSGNLRAFVDGQDTVGHSGLAN